MILSPAFFAKGWTNWELDALLKSISPVARERSARRSLANIIALTTTMGMAEVATKLMARLAPDRIIDSSMDERIVADLRDQVRQFVLFRELLAKGVSIDELIARVALTGGVDTLLRHYFKLGLTREIPTTTAPRT